jgi:hypothetical protein
MGMRALIGHIQASTAAGLNDSSRPKAGAHDRQLSGGPTQLQTEVVRGIRQRAQSRRMQCQFDRLNCSGNGLSRYASGELARAVMTSFQAGAAIFQGRTFRHEDRVTNLPSRAIVQMSA